MKALVILNTILEDEEYEDMECVASGFTKTYLEKSIIELESIKYNYEAQEIIIKSLEAQLSNTEQLTCDGCKWNGSVYGDWSEHCGNCRRNVIQEDDMFELKDTK